MSIPARWFCTAPHHKGPRWMLSVYFYRNKSSKSGLQHRCMTCTKIGMRAENLSDKIRRNRSEYSRRIKEDQRRAAGVPKRVTHNPKFDAQKLYTYLERFLLEEEFTYANGTQKEAVGKRMTLNGMPMKSKDLQFVRRLQTRSQRIPLQYVDELATRYDLPLWEMQEAAGCYKKDKRAVSRDRKLSASR